MPGNLDNDLLVPMPLPAAIPIDSAACMLHNSSGYLVWSQVAFTGQSGAASWDVFNFTGLIEVKSLWGVFVDVTDVTAITAASFDADDGAATVQISSAAGTALSGASLYSSIQVIGDNSVAVSFADSSQVRVIQGASGPKTFEETLLVAKSGQTNQIRLTCTTGAVEDFEIMFGIRWTCKYGGRVWAA